MGSQNADWLKRRARELRKDATAPERVLWQVLKGRKLGGLKFMRRFPLENYIVDFVCREKKFVIEIDGESHSERGSKDIERQTKIESLGYRVFRVSNDDVLRDIETVATAIIQAAGLDVNKWRNGTP